MESTKASIRSNLEALIANQTKSDLELIEKLAAHEARKHQDRLVYEREAHERNQVIKVLTFSLDRATREWCLGTGLDTIGLRNYTLDMTPANSLVDARRILGKDLKQSNHIRFNQEAQFLVNKETNCILYSDKYVTFTLATTAELGEAKACIATNQHATGFRNGTGIDLLFGSPIRIRRFPDYDVGACIRIAGEDIQYSRLLPDGFQVIPGTDLAYRYDHILRALILLNPFTFRGLIITGAQPLAEYLMPCYHPEYRFIRFDASVMFWAIPRVMI